MKSVSSILHLLVNIEHRTMRIAQKCDRSWYEEWEVELWKFRYLTFRWFLFCRFAWLLLLFLVSLLMFATTWLSPFALFTFIIKKSFYDFFLHACFVNNWRAFTSRIFSLSRVELQELPGKLDFLGIAKSWNAPFRLKTRAWWWWNWQMCFAYLAACNVFWSSFLIKAIMMSR